jgi:hypothetical protein
MANTTSGTVTFDKTFAVDDLIAEAYERIGSQVTSGYQLKSARRSLNILLWDICCYCTSATSDVYGVADVLEATFRQNRTSNYTI